MSNIFEKHGSLVRACLDENKLARNSDWHLLFSVLDKKGIKLGGELKQQIIDSGVNFHTVLRERQRIQSGGEYLPTSFEVLKRRRLLEKLYRENYKG